MWKLKDTLLDHIYTNLLEKELQTETLSFNISDHLPNITFTKSFTFQKPSIKQQWFRNGKNLDPEKFLQDLQNNLESLLDESLAANDYWNSFVNIFNSTLNQHAPLQPLSRREQRSKHSPWMTKELILFE